jgi:hypothetical protein
LFPATWKEDLDTICFPPQSGPKGTRHQISFTHQWILLLQVANNSRIITGSAELLVACSLHLPKSGETV